MYSYDAAQLLVLERGPLGQESRQVANGSQQIEACHACCIHDGHDDRCCFEIHCPTGTGLGCIILFGLLRYPLFCFFLQFLPFRLLAFAACGVRVVPASVLIFRPHLRGRGCIPHRRRSFLNCVQSIGCPISSSTQQSGSFVSSIKGVGTFINLSFEIPIVAQYLSTQSRR